MSDGVGPQLSLLLLLIFLGCAPFHPARADEDSSSGQGSAVARNRAVKVADFAHLWRRNQPTAMVLVETKEGTLEPITIATLSVGTLLKAVFEVGKFLYTLHVEMKEAGERINKLASTVKKSDETINSAFKEVAFSAVLPELSNHILDVAVSMAAVEKVFGPVIGSKSDPATLVRKFKMRGQNDALDKLEHEVQVANRALTTAVAIANKNLQIRRVDDDTDDWFRPGEEVFGRAELARAMDSADPDSDNERAPEDEAVSSQAGSLLVSSIKPTVVDILRGLVLINNALTGVSRGIGTQEDVYAAKRISAAGAEVRGILVDALKAVVGPKPDGSKSRLLGTLGMVESTLKGRDGDPKQRYSRLANAMERAERQFLSQAEGVRRRLEEAHDLAIWMTPDDSASPSLRRSAREAQRVIASVVSEVARAWLSMTTYLASPTSSPRLSESLRRIYREIVADGRSCRVSARFASSRCEEAYSEATDRCVQTRWFVVNSFKYALGARNRSMTPRICDSQERSPLMQHVMSSFAVDSPSTALPPDVYTMKGVKPEYKYACLERLMLPFMKDERSGSGPRDFLELVSKYMDKEPSVHTSAKAVVKALSLLTPKRFALGRENDASRLYRLLYTMLLNIGTLNLYIAKTAFPLPDQTGYPTGGDATDIDAAMDGSHTRADSRRLQYFADAVVDTVSATDLRVLRGATANNIEANRDSTAAPDGESVLKDYEIFQGLEGIDAWPVEYASISKLNREVYEMLHDSKSRGFLKRKLGEKVVEEMEEHMSTVLSDRIVFLDASKQKLREYITSAPAARMSQCTSEISKAVNGVCKFLTQKLTEKCTNSRLGKELDSKLAKAQFSGVPVETLTSAYDDDEEDEPATADEVGEEEDAPADESGYGREVFNNLFASMRPGLLSDVYSRAGEIASVATGSETVDGGSRALENSTLPELGVRVAALASFPNLGPGHPCLNLLSLMPEGHLCFSDVGKACSSENKSLPTNLSCATLLSDIPLLLKALAPRESDSLPQVYYVREYLRLYGILDGQSRLRAMSFAGWRALLGLASSFGDAKAPKDSQKPGLSLFDYISTMQCDIAPVLDGHFSEHSLATRYETVKCTSGESFLLKRWRVVNENDAVRVEKEVVANEKLRGATYVLPYHGYFFSRSGTFSVGIVFSLPSVRFTTLSSFIKENPTALVQSSDTYRRVAQYLMSIAVSMEAQEVYHMNIGPSSLFIENGGSSDMKLIVSGFEHAITVGSSNESLLPRYFVTSSQHMPPDALYRAIIASGMEEPDLVSQTDKSLLGESYHDPSNMEQVLAAWNTWSLGATLMAVLKGDPLWQRRDAGMPCEEQQSTTSSAIVCDYVGFMSLLGVEHEVSSGMSYVAESVIAVASSKGAGWGFSDVDGGINLLSRLLQLPYFARPELDVFIHHSFLQGAAYPSELPSFADKWRNCVMKQDSGDAHTVSCGKKTDFPVFPLVSKTRLVYNPKNEGTYTLEISFSIEKGFQDVLLIPKVEDDLGGLIETNSKLFDLCPVGIVNADTDGIVETMKVLKSGICPAMSEISVSIPMAGSVITPASPLRVRLVYFSKKSGLSTHYDVFFIREIHVPDQEPPGFALRLYEYMPHLGHRHWEKRFLGHRSQRKVCENFMSVMSQAYLLPSTRELFPIELLPPSTEQTELAAMFRGATRSQQRSLLDAGPIAACMALDGTLVGKTASDISVALDKFGKRGPRTRYLMPSLSEPLQVDESDRLFSEVRYLENCGFGSKSYDDDPAVLKSMLDKEMCRLCVSAVQEAESVLEGAKTAPSAQRVVFPNECHAYEKVADIVGYYGLARDEAIQTCISRLTRSKTIICYGMGRLASRMVFGRDGSEVSGDVDICEKVCNTAEVH